MDEKTNLDKMRLELEKEYYSDQMKPDRYKVLVSSVNDREYQLNKDISIKEIELDTMIQKDKWLDWIDIHLSNIDELNKIVGIKERKEVIKKYIEDIKVDWNTESKQHTITMSLKLPLVNDGINYRKGKKGQYLKDKKGFKKYDIIEGESQMTNPYLLLNSLNRY